MNQQTDELLFRWKFLKFKWNRKSSRCDLDSIFHLQSIEKRFEGNFHRNDSKQVLRLLDFNFQAIYTLLGRVVRLRWIVGSATRIRTSQWLQINSEHSCERSNAKKFWIPNWIEIQGARMWENALWRFLVQQLGELSNDTILHDQRVFTALECVLD